MTQDEREAMIETLSVMTFRDKKYFQDMSDERLCREYDKMMKYI